eukprot:952412-Rhodomonas_salina.1
MCGDVGGRRRGGSARGPRVTVVATEQRRGACVERGVSEVVEDHAAAAGGRFAVAYHVVDVGQRVALRRKHGRLPRDVRRAVV